MDGEFRLQLRGAQSLLMDQSVIAQHEAHSIRPCLDTAPRQGLEAFGFWARYVQSPGYYRL